MSRRLLMVRVGAKWLVPVCRTITEEDLPMFTGSVWQRALALLREYLRTRLVRGEIANPDEECVFHGNNFQVKLSARSSEAAAYSVLSRTTGRAAASGPYQRQDVLPQTIFMHIEPWVPPAAAAALGQSAAAAAASSQPAAAQDWEEGHNSTAGEPAQPAPQRQQQSQVIDVTSP